MENFTPLTAGQTRQRTLLEQHIIETPDAPKALGPYSQAVVVGQVIYCSGQIPLDPSTGNLVDGGIGDQVTRCISNLSAVLEAAGSALSSVVKTTLFLTSMDDYEEANVAYEKMFGDHAPPARPWP